MRQKFVGTAPGSLSARFLHKQSAHSSRALLFSRRPARGSDVKTVKIAQPNVPVQFAKKTDRILLSFGFDSGGFTRKISEKRGDRTNLKNGSVPIYGSFIGRF